MKNCIVTGGAGYIGSHCCKELAKAGYRPIVIDNLSGGHSELVKWGPLYSIDIFDRDSMDKIFKEHNPIAVFHFAGLISVGESVIKPGIYYKNNTAGTLRVLDAMKENGCGNIIFSSTAAVYGDPKHTPINETHERNPINPYGWSKFFSEQIIRDYSAAFGIKHAILRYFNAAGSDKDGDTGEMHNTESHLIPLVIKAALGKLENIEIFGNDFDTPDGTPIRDYIHVSDLVAAHVKALEHLLGDSGSICCNLGTGKGYSVMEIVDSVRRVSGRPVTTVSAPRRAGDPAILIADPSKANAELGWKCQIPEIDRIVETALNWSLLH